MTAECPGCGRGSESWESDLSDQLSGDTKAMICPTPAPECQVIHFKAAPKVMTR